MELIALPILGFIMGYVIMRIVVAAIENIDKKDE
jgi:hypothetical protein